MIYKALNYITCDCPETKLIVCGHYTRNIPLVDNLPNDDTSYLNQLS